MVAIEFPNSQEPLRPSGATCGEILIVEDHAATARLLTILLSEAFEGKAVAAVRSAEEMIDRCSRAPPRIVVMDISLPVMNGIEATRWIKSRVPSIAILIHSDLDPEIYLEECLRAGASAYVRKDQTKRHLIDDLKALLGT